MRGVTDHGLESLARSGCGPSLTSLSLLGRDRVVVFLVGSPAVLWNPFPFSPPTDIRDRPSISALENVSDAGLDSLASAGCGSQLTSLGLSCEYVLVLHLCCSRIGAGFIIFVE